MSAVSPEFVSVGVVLMTTYLLADNKKIFWIKAITKTLMSLMFLFVGYTQISTGNNNPLRFDYDNFLFLGLICGALGDVLLLGTSNRAFLSGLVVFLMGHLFYIIAFSLLFHFSLVGTLVGSNFLFRSLVSLAVLSSYMIYTYWLSPSLRNLRGPVLAYVIVITAMLLMSFVIYTDPQNPPEAATSVFYGAVLFFFSDLFVAREKFIQTTIVNRIIGLPAYYVAQFLLALTIGQFSK
eukprot:TRINITY_DN11704_c0_g1_i1.p1 TRINITY_DN11704_c0_g1~~TRINITY_DN11704_c0_g1_i1.p1  ORF type:complete len:237 (+),score=34.14 TRINITY_DN11704_c0_g1_i1:1-711(+)